MKEYKIKNQSNKNSHSSVSFSGQPVNQFLGIDSWAPLMLTNFGSGQVLISKNPACKPFPPTPHSLELYRIFLGIVGAALNSRLCR